LAVFNFFMMSMSLFSMGRSGLVAALVVWASLTQVFGAAKRVACVGDSITYGAGVRDRKFNAYPARLGRWLGGDYEVRNFGVSGTTLLKQADRPYVKDKACAAALEFKPDIVVIDLGANDSKHPGEGSLDSEKAINNWRFKTNFISDYEELIASFKKANREARIYVCLPTPDYPGRWGINGATIHDEMIPMIRQVAKDTDASIIDLYAALSGRPEWFPDTVHPNDDGTRAMARAVYQALRGAPAPDMPESAALLLLNRRVLWLGDSITHDGKYVTFVEYYLAKQFPAQNVDIIAIGLGSETVSGLSEKSHPFPRPCVYEHLQRAMEAVRPATVVACYGMNDGIYHPQGAERMAAFQSGIRRLSEVAQASAAQLVLLTPPPFDSLPLKNTEPETAPDFGYSHPFTNYDAVLGDYARWEMGLPVDNARVVVDLHSAVNAALRARREQEPAFSFAKDGVHPGAAGHLLMAQTVLHGFGIEVGSGDLPGDLARIEADPLYEQIRLRREKRSDAWRDFVGYTHEKTVKTGSVDEQEKEAAAAWLKIDELRKR
jgi:lysophospholipase L1-like esterase